MSSPKKHLPEHVATQIATTMPAGAPGQAGERRTAALPQAPVPTAAPHARTMTFDPYAQPGAHPAGGAQPRGRSPMPTVMTTPQGSSEPLPAPPSTAGRWIAGPLLATVVGVLTVWLAGMLTAGPLPSKNRGKLRLSSDPEGATVMVDGKVHPQATPTVIDGEIGATLRVGFKLDGYLDKEADVFVGEGERPFRAKLEKREAAPKVEPPPVDPPVEVLPPPPPLVPERTTRKTRRERPIATSDGDAVPVASGAGTLSVHVRPWAIVYIDGAKVRQTPLDGHSLGVGLHVVELVNDGIKKKEKVTVEIRANGHEEVRRDWEK